MQQSLTAFLQNRPAAMTANFVTCEQGGTLMLKLCGFIEAADAEILAVDEEHLRLRVGRTWLQRLWGGRPDHGPVEISLDLNRPNCSVEDWQRTLAHQVKVHASVLPVGRWQAKKFEDCAQGILHRLRWHLMCG